MGNDEKAPELRQGLTMILSPIYKCYMSPFPAFITLQLMFSPSHLPIETALTSATSESPPSVSITTRITQESARPTFLLVAETATFN
jgi:hypothetical protein